MRDGGAAVAALEVVAGACEVKVWYVGAAVVVIAGVDGLKVVDERLGTVGTVVMVILVVL